jgi:hypothetical protein
MDLCWTTPWSITENKHPIALLQEGAYFSNALLMGCYCTQNAFPFAKNKFFWMRCHFKIAHQVSRKNLEKKL